MELNDPVAVYDAAANVESHIVAMFLVEGGVNAFATVDHSLVGLWMFGTLPETSAGRTGRHAPCTSTDP
jgi:hypothetical protein